MARVTSNARFADRLKRALAEGLKKAGIKSKIDYEPVPQTKLFRFIVVARGFEKMGHSERQDLVWRIAGKTLTEDQELRISMILTMTPTELTGD